METENKFLLFVVCLAIMVSVLVVRNNKLDRQLEMQKLETVIKAAENKNITVMFDMNLNTGILYHK